MGMNEEQYEEFIERLDEEGEKREFMITIRVIDESALPSRSEITDALFNLVRDKTKTQEGDKQRFQVAVSTFSISPEQSDAPSSAG